MFGNNTQNDNQTNNPVVAPVVNDYDSDLPVGGEDLLAATNPPANNDNLGSASAPLIDNPSVVQPDDGSSNGDESAAPARDLTESGDSELLSIKQNALQELKPLVGQLEQSPEEKFRTTMMLIQASDDKSLLQSAYDQAQQIPDEKVKAQALLDVVNEINYFTQQDNQ